MTLEVESVNISFSLEIRPKYGLNSRDRDVSLLRRLGLETIETEIAFLRLTAEL